MISLNRISTEIRKAWTGSVPLTATAILMFVTFAACFAGIFLDHRTITGVPAWLKPAKFAISTAIFSGTIAWLFRYITVWPRFIRATGWNVAASLIVEIAIIDLQAARGTTSHFNAGTPLDIALFGFMGLSILILWLASVGVLVALFRQKFEDPAWGWWLRMGMLITVIGSATGGMMVRMTPEQREAARVGHSVTAVGAHTVGAPDGGPGVPGLGWSTQHGDLRIPHFLGLHGIQVIPFLGWLVRRRQTRFAITAAASYLGFIAILTWQALRGQSIIDPDRITLLVLAVWLGATAAFILALNRIDSHANLHSGAIQTI